MWAKMTSNTRKNTGVNVSSAAEFCAMVDAQRGMSAPGVTVRGPIMLGVEALALTEGDRARLADPRVGGVLLFARSFSPSAQLRALREEIRAAGPRGS